MHSYKPYNTGITMSLPSKRLSLLPSSLQNANYTMSQSLLSGTRKAALFHFAGSALVTLPVCQTYGYPFLPLLQQSGPQIPFLAPSLTFLSTLSKNPDSIMPLDHLNSFQQNSTVLGQALKASSAGPEPAKSHHAPESHSSPQAFASVVFSS